MRHATCAVVLAFGLAALGVAAEVSVDASNPGKLIETAATAMLQDLDAHRADYLKNPAKIEALVTQNLLPHFDTDYAAQMVLGRHWTSATPEQRRRFVDGFYHSILRNYSSALAGFKGNQLKVMPFTGDPNAANATVRSVVRSNSGENVPVNYTLHRVNGEWKAWDVIIEGISYVKSFRDDYSAVVEHDGLDALIVRLESQSTAKVPASKKP